MCVIKVDMYIMHIYIYFPPYYLYDVCVCINIILLESRNYAYNILHVCVSKNQKINFYAHNKLNYTRTYEYKSTNKECVSYLIRVK